MRPIKTLVLRVIAIAVALSFGLKAQEVKQGGYRTAQLKVTAGGSGWDFDTGNLIQLVLTDAKGNAESSGEYLTVGNDSPMPIKVSSKRVGIQNMEIGPGEQRRFKIQGYRRPNSQYSEFNSSVPVGIVYWSGPSPQETQQAVQTKAQKDSDARAEKERQAQEARRKQEVDAARAWQVQAQRSEDERVARTQVAAEQSRQKAQAYLDQSNRLGEMASNLQQNMIRQASEDTERMLQADEAAKINSAYAQANKSAEEAQTEAMKAGIDQGRIASARQALLDSAKEEEEEKKAAPRASPSPKGDPIAEALAPTKKNNPTAEDYAETHRRLARLTKQNHAEAQYLFASMLLNGVGCKRNVPRGVEELRKAAKNGWPAALQELATRQKLGDHESKNPVEAKHLNNIVRKNTTRPENN